MRSPLFPARVCSVVFLALTLQGRPTAAAEAPFFVTINPEKPLYLKGEPVALILRITYIGANAIEVPHPLDKRGYREDVEMASPGGNEFRPLFTLEEASDELAERARPMPRVRFEPNATIIKTNWYHCWSEGLGQRVPRGLVFPEAGEYKIRARVTWQEMRTHAAGIVTVGLPSAEADQKAYEWLERSGVLCTLTHLWEQARGPKEYGREAAKFQKLRDEYPRSVFTTFLDRTYMTASNIIARPDNKFLHLLGEKPKPTRASP